MGWQPVCVVNLYLGCTVVAFAARGRNGNGPVCCSFHEIGEAIFQSELSVEVIIKVVGGAFCLGLFAKMPG